MTKNIRKFSQTQWPLFVSALGYTGLAGNASLWRTSNSTRWYFSLWRKMPLLLLSCVQTLLLWLCHVYPFWDLGTMGSHPASHFVGPELDVGSMVPGSVAPDKILNLSLCLTFFFYIMVIIIFRHKVIKPNEIIYLKHLMLGT